MNQPYVTISSPNPDGTITLYRVPRDSYAGAFQDCFSGLPVYGTLPDGADWQTERWEKVETAINDA